MSGTNFEAITFILKKLRELKALFSFFAIEDNYATTKEVLKMLRHMNIYSNESEINGYMHDNKFSLPIFLIIYNDLNTAYLYENLRQLHRKSEIDLDVTSLDYFLIFNTPEDAFVELYRNYYCADFYDNVLNDLDFEAILNNQRITQIILKYISLNNFYQ